jgi:hypothetical protein
VEGRPASLTPGEELFLRRPRVRENPKEVVRALTCILVGRCFEAGVGEGERERERNEPEGEARRESNLDPRRLSVARAFLTELPLF